MRLRFRADYRALIWALVLFPLAPLAAYARPELAPWLFPVALYFAYCSGVLAHNHNHCPVFRARPLNVAYGAWLSVFYGFPLFAWVPTHDQNHHRYLNGPGDDTRTTRHAARDTFWAALTYPSRSSLWQLPAILRYVAEARTRPGRRRRIVFELTALLAGQLGLAALAVLLHGPRLGLFVYALAAGLPALFAPWSMMLTNYLQHAGCDPSSRDDHSRNFVSPFWNWFVFDNGYHTVHHERPGTHWSRYRELHARRAPRIAPHLNQSTPLAYCVDRYLLGPRRGTAPAQRQVEPMPAPPSAASLPQVRPPQQRPAAPSQHDSPAL